MTGPLDESLANLEAARRALRAAFDAVPAARRGEQPAQDRWSANEVIEHLSLVEKRFTAIVALRIAQAREAGLGPEVNPREALPTNLRQMLNDRASRRVAQDAVQPRGEMDHLTAWAELERVRQDLVATVAPFAGLALSTVTHQHPVFGTLNVYQLLDFLAGHETRHARQVRGIADAFAAR